MPNGSTDIKDYRRWGLREITYLIVIASAIIAIVSWFINMNGRLFANETQRDDVLLTISQIEKNKTIYKANKGYEHSLDTDVHQKHREKMKEWYTRKEGEDNRKSIQELQKEINELNQKMYRDIQDIKAILLQQLQNRRD